MERSLVDLLKHLGSAVKGSFERTDERLSFDEYLQRVYNDPYRETRTSYQFIRDAVLSFGSVPVKDCGRTFPYFKLFEDPFFDGRKRVVGQLRPIAALFKHIDACAKQEEDENILVLVGPPGTGKSRIFMLIEKGLEAYSRTPAGAVYSVHWLFRERFEEEGDSRMGFRRLDELARETGSYAHLTEEEIFSRIECPLRDHPLSVIPRVERRQFLDGLLEGRRALLRSRIRSSDSQAAAELERLEEILIPEKISEIEPCRNCQHIRDRLLVIYKGDWEKVMKHIQVVRFTFSLETGRGLAEVDPGVNVETEISPVSADESKVLVSSLLKGLRLFMFYGKPAHANRGLINYQDIFNKNHSQLQHLLSAIEEKTIDFGEVSQKVDMAIVGSSNIAESNLLAENVMTAGLRDRIEQLPVPYLVNYREEEKIYAPNVQEIRKRQHISPHTVEGAALFGVLTRMAKPDLSGYFEIERKKIEQFRKEQAKYDARRALLTRQQEALKLITLPAKARLYANDMDWVPPELKEAFTDAFCAAVREENRATEGLMGKSPRWVKRLLGMLSRDEENPCINPFQLYATIIEVAGPEAMPLLEMVQSEYNHWVVEEVEEALFEVKEADILARVNLYLDHAKAFVKKESVHDPFQRKQVDPEERLNREEEFLGIAAKDRSEFRVQMIQQVARRAAPEGGRPDPRVAVPDLVQRYKQRTYRAVKVDFNFELFLNTLGAFEPAEHGIFADLDPDDLETHQKALGQVFKVINNMRHYSTQRAVAQGQDERAGYCNDCARKVIKYALTNEQTRGQFLPGRE